MYISTTTIFNGYETSTDWSTYDYNGQTTNNKYFSGCTRFHT